MSWPEDGEVTVRPAVTPGSGAMFDRIARRYDLLNRVLSMGADRKWRRQAAAALGLARDVRILDLASGTGDMALEVLRQCPTAHVVGLDPSLRMLLLARHKTGTLAGFRFVVGDAQALPFRPEAFDAVTMAFGIRNVPDRLGALGEIRRVLRPGGRAAILELAEPRRGRLAGLARVWVRVVIPWLGGLLSGGAEYRYLQRSMEDFPTPDAFVALMRRGGLADPTVTPMMLGAVHLFEATSAAPGNDSDPEREGADVTGRALAELLTRRSPDRFWLATVPAPAAPVELLWDIAPAADAFAWTSPSGTTLAGIGTTLELEGQGHERFQVVERHIERELAQVDCVAIPGSTVQGPVLFGGGAFTPGAADRPPWTGFADARFVLSRWTYRVTGDTASLTLALPPGAVDTRAVLAELDDVLNALQANRHVEAPPRLVGHFHDESVKAWSAAVSAAQVEMAAGHLAKVVLARHMSADLTEAARRVSLPAELLRRLRAEGNDIYRFGVRTGGKAFLGASPELLVARQGLDVRAEALAGSLPRQEQADQAALARLAEALQEDPKQLEEHGLVVAALRRRLSVLCDDLTAPSRPTVRVLRRVLHLSTSFQGRLRHPVSVLALAAELHPTPAVGGEPGVAALAFIAGHEAVPRGWFAGPIGVVEPGGNGELAVALRSVLLHGTKAHLWAGAGILPASAAATELAETRVKARSCMDALGVTL